MHEGQRRLGVGVCQIRIEAAHLGGDQHALVDDRARAHRADIEDLAGEGAFCICLLLDHAAAYIEGTLEVLALRSALRTAQEGLDDRRHAGTGRAAQIVVVGRHGTPEEQGNPLCGAAILEDALGNLEAFGILGEEEHRDAVVALIRQEVPIALGLAAEEAMRDLEQDARTVAGVVLEALAASMLEVHKDAQRVIYHLVGTLALEVGQGSNAAGIMFKFGAVEPLRSIIAARLGLISLRARVGARLAGSAHRFSP